jgi:hypothetical protein
VWGKEGIVEIDTFYFYVFSNLSGKENLQLFEQMTGGSRANEGMPYLNKTWVGI